MTKKAINLVFPNSLSLLAASSLMTATYLVAEPISRRVYEACTTDKTIGGCLNDIKNDIVKQYPTAIGKITALWNHFFGPKGSPLGDSDSRSS